ncbi:MAG: hypothetical protein ACPGTQ_11960 [Colwellia sp.]
MTLLKKVIIGWLGLCVVMGSWALITGNTSEEAALQNELADICEDAFEEMEGKIANEFMMMALDSKFQDRNRKANNPLKLEVEYDDDIEPVMDAKRGYDRRELNLSCQQKLISNYKGIEPVAVIMVHIDKHGDVSYELSDYDIYDTVDKIWWSDI